MALILAAPYRLNAGRPERFAEVADIFAAKGYKTVFFGGPMDEEMVSEATGYMQTRPIIATGHFAIGGLARCNAPLLFDYY